MKPRELEIHIAKLEASIDERFDLLNREIHKLRRNFLMEVNEMKKRPEFYSPRPREPIVPPPFPDALRDLGLEEPNGSHS